MTPELRKALSRYKWCYTLDTKEIEAAIEAIVEEDRRKRDGAITWDTTCFNCADILNKSYDSYAEGHKAGVRDGLAPVEEYRDNLYKNSYRIWAKTLGKAIAKGKRNG